MKYDLIIRQLQDEEHDDFPVTFDIPGHETWKRDKINQLIENMPDWFKRPGDIVELETR